MIEWAQISKPQKIPGPKINLKKKSQVEFPSLINFGDMWAPSRIFALFEYPEYPYLNQANQKILALKKDFLQSRKLLTTIFC